MSRKFNSSIETEKMTIDTIVDQPQLAFGDSLTGTVYIDGCTDGSQIDYVRIELFKRHCATKEEKPITKHDIEMVGNVKSKNVEMIPFELVPDDRWEVSTEYELVLRTSLHLFNEPSIFDEDVFEYDATKGYE